MGKQKGLKKECVKIYTEEEFKKVMLKAMTDYDEFLISEYNVRYSLCLATALSMPPFNFGRKRVCTAVKSFFDLVEKLQLEEITEDQMAINAERLGVTAKYINDIFVVNVDPNSKDDESKNIFIGG